VLVSTPVDAQFRSLFNEAFTEDLYRGYVAELSRRLGVGFPFRHAETPVFVPRELLAHLTRTADALIAQLMEPARIERMKSAIPARWDTPNLTDLPSFGMIDLAIVRDASGRLVPRLIELQGFPSLTALQVFKRDVWTEKLASIGMEREWSCWFSGLDRAAFLDLARRTIVGEQDPEHVILMDLDPPTQGTYSDFLATRQLFGVEPVCPTALVKEGRRLFRRSEDGRRKIPVKRIYNRVVFDELARKELALPFDWREPLEVEWTPHPNWFFIWSKASIPFLSHPDVPKATLVSELDRIPDDLSPYVLKPLFSFSGGGVKVPPTRADIEAIPAAERSGWCLQERVEYAPAIVTPEGEGVKCEIRMMYLKPDGARPVLATNLARLARGHLIGTAFNKDFTWVGSTVALWPPEHAKP
jgi:hypothetical protein